MSDVSGFGTIWVYTHRFPLCVPSALQTTLLTYSGALQPLQPDFNSKGPLIKYGFLFLVFRPGSYCEALRLGVLLIFLYFIMFSLLTEEIIFLFGCGCGCVCLCVCVVDFFCFLSYSIMILYIENFNFYPKIMADFR